MADFVPDIGKDEREPSPGEEAQKLASYVVMGILFAEIPLTEKQKAAVAPLVTAFAGHWNRLGTTEKRTEWVMRVLTKLWKLL